MKTYSMHILEKRAVNFKQVQDLLKGQKQWKQNELALVLGVEPLLMCTSFNYYNVWDILVGIENA